MHDQENKACIYQFMLARENVDDQHKSFNQQGILENRTVQ